ncbi:hypothetical protein P9Z94_07710 [Bacillus thuringiensis]|nr:hypothetical protein [Bacillus thuringiensis]MEC3155991.1 hypothetical protein [Bacillus thuringiensis]
MRKIGILLLGVIGAFTLVLNTGAVEKEHVASKQKNIEHVQYMSQEPGGH